MCKKLLIVTNCDPKRTKESEKYLKEIYLNKDSGPSLSFAHKGAKPHEILKLVKEKKPAILVFEENVPHEEIKAIMNAIVKHASKKPRMIHINPAQYFPEVEHLPNHMEVVIQIAA